MRHFSDIRVWHMVTYPGQDKTKASTAHKVIQILSEKPEATPHLQFDCVNVNLFARRSQLLLLLTTQFTSHLVQSIGSSGPGMRSRWDLACWHLFGDLCKINFSENTLWQVSFLWISDFPICSSKICGQVETEKLCIVLRSRRRIIT